MISLLSHSDCRNAGDHLCSRFKVWWYVGNGSGVLSMIAIAFVTVLLLGLLLALARRPR